MERTSEKIEILTYMHATEEIRNGCVNHQAKRVDSRTILLLIARPECLMEKNQVSVHEVYVFFHNEGNMYRS